MKEIKILPLLKALFSCERLLQTLFSWEWRQSSMTSSVVLWEFPVPWHRVTPIRRLQIWQAIGPNAVTDTKTPLAVLLCVWYYSEKWGSKTETSQENYNDEEEVGGEEPWQEGTKRGRKNKKGGVDWSWKGVKNGWCQCCKGKIPVVSPHLTVSWQRCRFRPRRKGASRELICC